jgi:hypothetical protein
MFVWRNIVPCISGYELTGRVPMVKSDSRLGETGKKLILLVISIILDGIEL